MSTCQRRSFRQSYVTNHGYRCGKCTNTETRDETADSELCPLVGGSDLDDNTDDEHNTLGGHCKTTSEEIRSPEDVVNFPTRGLQERQALTKIREEHQSMYQWKAERQ